MNQGPTLRKRLAHRIKAAVHDRPTLDLWLDAGTSQLGGPARSAWLWLFPERRQPVWPFDEPERPPNRGRVLLLGLVPPEDTGGASRPARLAVELHRRGFAIDWRWALDIYPVAAARRPRTAGVGAAPVREGTPLAAPDFVLVEAPHPAFVPIVENIDEGIPVLFEQIDAWTGDLATGWYDRASEDRILARASVHSATAAALRAAVEERTARPCALVPNGVDAGLFDPGRVHPPPPGLVHGEPTIVFIGALWGDWIDHEAIVALADARPRAAIHLVGRGGDRPLPARPNLHVHGERPRAEIPAWLQHAQAALVPFREGVVATATSPLKAYEALAMGCPVAATGTGEIFGMPGVAGGPGVDLVAATDRAAAMRISPTDAAGFAATHSWAARVDRLLELVDCG